MDNCGRISGLLYKDKTNPSWGRFVTLSVTLVSISNKFQVEEPQNPVDHFLYNLHGHDGLISFVFFVVCLFVIFVIHSLNFYDFCFEGFILDDYIKVFVVVSPFWLHTCLFVFCFAMCSEESIWFGAHRGLVGGFARCVFCSDHLRCVWHCKHGCFVFVFCFLAE